MSNPNAGQAPDTDHPRRCKARSQRTGLRCRRWAMKGVLSCQYHGGRTAQKYIRSRNMPMFYGKYMGATLEKRIQEFMTAPAGEQVSLYEELAVMRDVCGQSVKLYEAATTPQAKILAAELLKDALKEVRDMCSACSKIEKDAEDKISSRNISVFINQICRSIYLAIEQNGGLHGIDLGRSIEKGIRSNVRMPEEIVGTSLTPAEIVREMNLLTVEEG